MAVLRMLFGCFPVRIAGTVVIGKLWAIPWIEEEGCMDVARPENVSERPRSVSAARWAYSAPATTILRSKVSPRSSIRRSLRLRMCPAPCDDARPKQRTTAELAQNFSQIDQTQSAKGSVGAA